MFMKIQAVQFAFLGDAQRSSQIDRVHENQRDGEGGQGEAAAQTRVAAELATTALQLELAHRQAASIRATERGSGARRSHAAVFTLLNRARRVFIRE